MIKLRINNKYLNIIENIYFFMFVTYAILSTNSFTYGKPIISIVMWPTFLLGLVIAACRVWNFKDYYKMPGLIFLVAMLASIGVSTLLNHNYSFKANVIFCFYWLLFFFVCYIKCDGKSKEELRKDFENIALLFAIYFTVGAIISFVLMFSGVSVKLTTEDTNYEYYIGFIYGRLWGMYINPNNAAISSAISTVIYIYFISKSKKLVAKIGCGAAIFTLLMYIALSDSRSGAVCTGVVCGIYAFVVLGYKFKEKKIMLKVFGVLLAAVLAVMGFAVPRTLKTVYNDISVKITEYREENPKDDPDKENDPFKAPVIDRGYDLSDDVSNRRFDVWKSGVEIFLSSPKNMLIGTSYNGILDYAKEKMPETYIVSNGYAEIDTMDNEFFNVMVSQGALGVIVIAAFVVYIIITLLKNLFKFSGEDSEFCGVLLAIIAGLSVSAMFCSVMFYHFSPNSIIFWIALGGLIFLINSNNKKVENGGEN